MGQTESQLKVDQSGSGKGPLKFSKFTEGLRRVGMSRQNSSFEGKSFPNSYGESASQAPGIHESGNNEQPFASSSASQLSHNPFEFPHGEESEAAAINNSIDALKPSFLVFIITAMTSFCGFMSGYDTGYVSGALVIMDENDLHTTLTSGNKELITAATSLGALITALIGGSCADAFGRKWVITFANITFILGAGLQTGANSLWMMIGGRFVMGFGVGFASLVAPMYLSEMAPTRFRGRLVVVNVLALTFGQLVAYAIGYGVTNVRNGWRILVGLSLIPSVTQLFVFAFMPESPRYLVSRGRIEDAQNVLRSIYQGATQSQVSAKIAEITSDMPVRALTSSDDVSYAKKMRSAFITFEHNLAELFRRPSNRRGLAIIVVLQALQQFSGWNSLLYYSGTMFKSVGFANSTAVSIIIAATNFVFTGVAFLIIDRIGRRVLLVGTMWGMVVGLVVVAVAFQHVAYDPSGKISPEGTDNKWSVMIIVFIFVFAMSYASGIGNIPWQQSEMLPMQVRGIGTSFSTAMNWGGSLTISATFLTMLDKITPTGTFAFYAGVCFVGWILTIFFYPETANLNLEDIQGLLADGFNVRKSVALSKRKTQLARPHS